VILVRSDRVGPFQRALQAGRPLALEEDKIVVGYGIQEQREAAHLDVPANRRALLDALELVVGQKVEFRHIQGETRGDWEKVKAAEARVAARAKAAPMAGEAEIKTLWDELIARLNRGYNELPRRRYPQDRAAFFREALAWVEETREKARALGLAEEALARELARSIERLAGLVEIPPVMVAIALAQRKHEN